MPNLYAIRQQLSRIRSKLYEMPVLTTGRPVDDKKADEQQAQLELILEQLEIIARDFKSDAHLAQVLIKAAKKAPTGNRWSMNASAEQKLRNAGLLIAEVEALVASVRDLLQKNGLLNPIQVGKDVIELIEDLQKHLQSSTKAGAEQRTNWPVYRQPETGELHLEAIGPLITFLIVAIRYWKQKRSRKSD